MYSLDMSEGDGYVNEILLLACGIRAPLIFMSLVSIVRVFISYDGKGDKVALAIEILLTPVLLFTKSLIVDQFVEYK